MKNIGFIGTGNMGSAIIKGVAPLDSVTSIHGFDVYTPILEKLEQEVDKFTAAEDVAGVINSSDFIILAVKPYQIQEILEENRETLGKGKCIVSIAAGITMKQLQTWSGGACPVVRCMPNTPTMVGEGVYALCFDDSLLGDDQKSYLEELFKAVGQVHVLTEKYFDAFTAVAGSGPAYVFYFMEAIIEAAVTLGLPRPQATEIVEALLIGSAKLAAHSDLHISQLREMVCSPAGTSIEALNVMDRNAVRSTIVQAILRCAERSKELGEE